MVRLAAVLSFFVARVVLASEIHIVTGPSSGLDTSRPGVVTCPGTSCDLQASSITSALTVIADDISVEANVTNASVLTLRADAACDGSGTVTAGLGQISGATVYTHDNPGGLVLSGAATVYTLLDTLDELEAIAANGTYAVNCDLAGGAFQTIPTFSGVLDGELHAIADVVSDGNGLFGTLEDGAQVRNLVLVRPVITTSASSTTGSLAGVADQGALVQNIAVLAGRVTGTTATGGLFGTIRGASVDGAYVTGSVTGTSTVGGVVGLLDGVSGSIGTLTNAASKASISASASGGGLVGSITGLAQLSASWSAGAVAGGGAVGGGTASSVASSVFWDTQASGQTISNGGTGLTTSQTHAQSSFTGFDFASRWRIRANVSRPFLQIFEPLLNLALAVSGNGTTAFGSNVTFTVTATPTRSYANASGAVIVRDSGTSIGNGTLTNNTTTVSTSTLAVGSHAITALFRGDNYYLEIVSPAVTHVVTSGGVIVQSTSTTVSVSPTTIDFGDQVTFSATVTADTGTPSGTVSFIVGGEVVATAPLVNGSASVTIIEVVSGTLFVTASYTPDVANYATSISEPVTLTVEPPPPPPPFTLTIGPSSQRVFVGGSAHYVMTLTGRGAVNFACGPLPQATTCTFDQEVVPVGVRGAVATLIVSTQQPYPVAGPLQRPPWWIVAIAAGALLFVYARPRLATLALMTALACTDDSGRAYVPSEGTPPGTYVITIIAQSADRATSQDVVLTVD